MAFSVQTMADSFFFSNMSPQVPAFNRGIWKRLEEQVRKFALQEGEIMVVTGPVLPKEKSITIGNNKVTVPDRYYKVVYDLTPPQKMIGFIIPNNGSTRPLQDFAVTVDAVEKETGLNFFSLVPGRSRIVWKAQLHWMRGRGSLSAMSRNRETGNLERREASDEVFPFADQIGRKSVRYLNQQFFPVFRLGHIFNVLGDGLHHL